jgi:hypothetical protein
VPIAIDRGAGMCEKIANSPAARATGLRRSDSEDSGGPSAAGGVFVSDSDLFRISRYP